MCSRQALRDERSRLVAGSSSRRPIWRRSCQNSLLSLEKQLLLLEDSSESAQLWNIFHLLPETRPDGRLQLSLLWQWRGWVNTYYHSERCHLNFLKSKSFFASVGSRCRQKFLRIFPHKRYRIGITITSNDGHACDKFAGTIRSTYSNMITSFFTGPTPGPEKPTTQGKSNISLDECVQWWRPDEK